MIEGANRLFCKSSNLSSIGAWKVVQMLLGNYFVGMKEIAKLLFVVHQKS